MTRTAHRTRMICTIGPASDAPGVLGELIAAGMAVARVNFSHGTHEDIRRRVERIRAAASRARRRIPVMGDLQGPKLRIGRFATPVVTLRDGAPFTVTTRDVIGDASIVSADFPHLHRFVHPGDRIFFGDGQIELVVERVAGRDIRCRVVIGGELSARKGIAVAERRIPLPGVTTRDLADLALGAALGLEWFAHSFVRTPDHVDEVRYHLRKLGVARPFVIAKIEDREGFDHLDGIISAADGVMVARGDLGVSVHRALVPVLQHRIIQRCNAAKKPDIVATQMLETMTVNPYPTRAEVNDVATAVLQGADYVMLSGETAAGKYPVLAAREMATIIATVEKHLCKDC